MRSFKVEANEAGLCLVDNFADTTDIVTDEYFLYLLDKPLEYWPSDCIGAEVYRGVLSLLDKKYGIHYPPEPLYEFSFSQASKLLSAL